MWNPFAKPEPKKQVKVEGIRFQQRIGEDDIHIHTFYPTDRWELNDGHLYFYQGDRLAGECVGVLCVALQTFYEDEE